MIHNQFEWGAIMLVLCSAVTTGIGRRISISNFYVTAWTRPPSFCSCRPHYRFPVNIRHVASLVGSPCNTIHFHAAAGTTTVPAQTSETASWRQQGWCNIKNSYYPHHRQQTTCPTALFSTEGSSTEVDPGIIPGTELRICKYPHPALRTPNAFITDSELKEGSSAVNQFVKEMFLVMYAAKGVGLAAPQVGINKRLMVYNPTGDPSRWIEEVTMINPKIVEYSQATDVDMEACLSFPNMSGEVERSKWIKVEALNLRGKLIKRKFTGWEARIFQHEYDHLDGVVYIDRLTNEGRKEVQPTLDTLVQDYGGGGAL